MPLTLAHSAAVLPLRRVGLPMAALAIGSMVPDVPLFMHWPSGYHVTHSVAGVVTADLVGTLALLWAWNAFVRDALVDLAPQVVRDRLSARHRLSRRQWLLAPVAAVLGTVTHLAWDAFTHPGRWGVMHVAWLRADLGVLPAFKWAQYASGVIGLGVVCWAVLANLRSRPATQPRRRRALPAPLLPLVVCAAGTYGLLAGPGQGEQRPPRRCLSRCRPRHRRRGCRCQHHLHGVVVRGQTPCSPHFALTVPSSRDRGVGAADSGSRDERKPGVADMRRKDAP